MQYIENLPVKYLTDTYKLLKDYPSSETDIIFTIIDDIKKSRRTKKNWNIEDYIFSKEILENDIDIDPLINLGYISFDSETQLFTLTNEGLRLIFKI